MYKLDKELKNMYNNIKYDKVVKNKILEAITQVNFLIKNIQKLTCVNIDLKYIEKIQWNNKYKNSKYSNIIEDIIHSSEKFSLNKINNIYKKVQSLDIKKQYISSILNNQWGICNDIGIDNLSKKSRENIIHDIENYWHINDDDDIIQLVSIIAQFLTIRPFSNYNNIIVDILIDIFFFEKKIIKTIYPDIKIENELIDKYIKNKDYSMIIDSIMKSILQSLDNYINTILNIIQNLSHIKIFILHQKEKDLKKYNKIMSFVQKNGYIDYNNTVNILNISKNTSRKVLGNLKQHKVILEKKYDKKRIIFTLNHNFYKDYSIMS